MPTWPPAASTSCWPIPWRLDEGFPEDGGRRLAASLIGPAYTDLKWFGEGAGIAIRKGETDLVDAFNAAIKKIRDDGTYKEINAQYFDFDVYGDPGM